MKEIKAKNSNISLKERMVDFIKKLPPIISEISNLLFATGWFYDWRLNEFEKLSTMLAENKQESIDSVFMRFYKKNLKIIEQTSIERFENRKLIIKKAFKAHKKKDYDIAIILLLTQIDGIFMET